MTTKLTKLLLNSFSKTSLLSQKVCPHYRRLLRTNCLSLKTKTYPTNPVMFSTHNYTTIAIEGNIGSGKTTFLKHLQTFNTETTKHIECFGEPIDKWRDVRGLNLFQLLSEDINRWCFPFQSYVQLSMLEVHQKVPKSPEVAVKLMERSLYSERYCFVENLYRRTHLREEEYAILDEWFQYLIKSEPKVGVDLIIYLRTDPEVVFDRIQKRNRSEEQNLTIEYLKNLHDLHEEWLLGDGSKFPKPAPVVTIDANQDLAAVKRVYDKHSADIISGSAFKQNRNVCKQY